MKRYIERVKKYSDRRWYLPFICLLSFIDVFVLFIPTEGLIVLTGILKPKRWPWTALAVTTASSLGALLLGTLGHHYGEPFVAWIMGPDFFEKATWIKMSGWIEHYGFWGLWFIAVGPLPQQPAILICALAHMPLPEIFWAVYLGRAPKYFLFSYLATHSPKWFEKAFGEEFAVKRQPPDANLPPST